ncbi:MAG TPA: hypothetical protein VG944_02805 [Fimbriimonas sp.]|nr:hypothetical protein [Fimbriimonas sp.]
MILTLLAASLALSQGDAPLTPQPPIVIPGGAGKFDFMGIDAGNHLVFASHPGKSSIAVLNTETGKAVDVPVGVEVNGVAADSKGKRLFGAGPGKTLVVVDTTNFSKIGALPLDGPGDCVQFDKARGVVYVDNDDGTNLWVVDGKALKLSSAITIKEAPEYMEYDSGTDRIYQAIKSANTVQVIDAAGRKVLNEFTLGELSSPHGLALDKKTRRLFVAGKNGKLVMLDADTGKLLKSVEVLQGSDQIAYDSGNKRLYIPAQGQIQVVQITGDDAAVLGSVPVGKDCHRVAIERRTHSVWVAYSEGAESYFQKFAAK